MGLGQRKLFADLQDDSPQEPKKWGKGKRPDLLAARDEKLVYRYYYLSEVKRMRYDDTLKQLELEFDIAVGTVIDRLSNVLYSKVKEVYAEKPLASELQRRWPWLVW